MTASPCLPLAAVVDASGEVLASTAGAQAFIGMGADGRRLRCNPPIAELSQGAVGSVTDGNGRQLCARFELHRLSEGQLLVFATSPYDRDAYTGIYRALMHDLRSPLATAQLLCQSLAVELERAGGEAAALGANYLGRALGELARMNQMLDLCRGLGYREHPPNPPSDLGVALRAVARRQERGLRRNGISVRLSEGPAPTACFDPRVFSAVIGALLLVAAEGGGAEAGWVGLGSSAEAVWVVAPGLKGVELDAVLGPSPVGPDRLSWVEVGLMAARWLAEGEGGRLSGEIAEDGSATLRLAFSGA